jgi:hypothetical protein
MSTTQKNKRSAITFVLRKREERKKQSNLNPPPSEEETPFKNGIE